MGKRRRKGSDDPIGDYIEWSNNRYNPGYWLGGRTPPNVKNLWSPKDRRWMGAVLLPSSCLAVPAAGAVRRQEEARARSLKPEARSLRRAD
jgi:hypothetical protein